MNILNCVQMHAILPWCSRVPGRAESGISDSDGSSQVQSRRDLNVHPKGESMKDIWGQENP